MDHSNYFNISPHGRSAFAQSLRAESTKFDAPVLIKLYAPNIAEFPNGIERFITSVRAFAGIELASITSPYEAGRSTNRYLYVTRPWIDARSLGEIVESEELPVSIIREIAAEIADALCQLHDRGLVHGALTPNNIFIAQSGTLVLTDPLPDVVADLNPSAMQSLGPFVSPEVVAGHTARTSDDVFVLGSVIQFMMGNHILPETLGTILDECHSNPNDRPSAAELASQLRPRRMTVSAPPEPDDLPNPPIERERGALFAARNTEPALHPEFTTAKVAPENPFTPDSGESVNLVPSRPIPPSPMRRRRRAIVPALIVVAILGAVLAAWILWPSTDNEAVTTDTTTSTVAATSTTITVNAIASIRVNRWEFLDGPRQQKQVRLSLNVSNSSDSELALNDSVAFPVLLLGQIGAPYQPAPEGTRERTLEFAPSAFGLQPQKAVDRLTAIQANPVGLTEPFTNSAGTAASTKPTAWTNQAIPPNASLGDSSGTPLQPVFYVPASCEVLAVGLITPDNQVLAVQSASEWLPLRVQDF